MLSIIIALLVNLLIETSVSFSVVVPRDPVVAHVGSTVILPCRISPPENAEALEIRWYRQDKFNNPVLLYNHGKLQDTQEESYRNRTSFTLWSDQSGGLQDGDVSLRLEKLRVQDEGSFHCYVSGDTAYDGREVVLKIMDPSDSLDLWKTRFFSVLSVLICLILGLVGLILYKYRGKLTGKKTAEENCEEETSEKPTKEVVGDDVNIEELRKYAVEFTIDRRHVHPNLRVSLDNKSIKDNVGYKYTGEAFPNKLCAFGAQKYSSGRHYWEVELVQKKVPKNYWLIGVMKDENIGVKKHALTPSNGYWFLCSEGENGIYSNTDPSTKLSLTLRPERLGVLLDCDDGQLSFYNVKERKHLLTISSRFSGSVVPLFNPGVGDLMSFSVVVPVDPVVAHVGSTVILSCWISPPENAEEMEIRWYRQDQFNSPVLLYNQGKTQDIQECFRSRTSLSRRSDQSGGLKDGDVSLRLEKITFQDEGLFQCYVSGDTSYDSKIVDLKITDPSDSVGLWKTRFFSVLSVLICLILGLVGLILYKYRGKLTARKKPAKENCEEETMEKLTKEVSFTLVVPADPVVAHVGSTVILPCWISPPENAEALEIRWYRQDQFSNPVLLYNYGKIQDTQEEPYKNRSSFTQWSDQSGGLKDGDICLRLEKLTLQDEGPFHCYVSGDTAYDSKAVDLKIIDSSGPWKGLFFTVLIVLLCLILGLVWLMRYRYRYKLTVNPIMTTSADEKPGHVKKDEEEEDIGELRKYAVEITIDSEHSNPDLMVTKNCKMVKASPVYHHTGEAFPYELYASGAQRFASGRHYWEVELARENTAPKDYWLIGVMRDGNFLFKDRSAFIPSRGYWFLCSDGPHGFHINTDPPVKLPLTPRPEQLGVLLDYDDGLLSFYNVKESKHLLTISSRFSGSVVPLFNPGVGDQSPLEILDCPKPAKSAVEPSTPLLSNNSSDT
ncbi:hypothetical protein Q8A67_001596 [Cirrhinus molitorella]|uniref:Butyrophilin subfamily 1 member A1-like n=1 Tax=Cirrhinus molitorella TaxID=172907 RepID=A0AA88Q4I6_9TELE|nr:hypothetical protein Q8A67_001596 [Cirrhinus molitorella]